ncbi:hypothetical protein D3C85_1183740 [compost metagenome]
MTFKPNTRVRILTNPYDSLGDVKTWKGQLGTVVDADEYYVDVRLDSGYSKDADDVWPFAECELEIVKED